MIPKLAQCVVLDTNVCLDLFVFRDPRWAPLMAGLRDGSIQAVTRADCRREWEIVLTYPHLPQDDAKRSAAAAEFDSLISCVALEDYVAPEVRMPVCKDTDDQKFLETAWQVGAAVLITKDKALLKLARRTAKLGLFSILRPDAWVLAHTAAPELSQTAKIAADPD